MPPYGRQLSILGERRVALTREICIYGHEDRGENITAALLGKVSSGGGCPRFVVLNLGLGVDVSLPGVCDAGGTEALLRQRSLAFYYVQLLSAAAAVEDGARAGHLRERVGEGAQRDGISSSWLCGDAGACASLDERAAAGNAVDGAAEAEATCGAETAKAPKAGERGADAIAFCGDRRTAGSVLASAVLRFQCVQPRKEEGKVELHTRESSDSRTGETSERLAVEQLGFLPWRSGGARGDRRGRVRRESNPKTQVQTTNLGHPPYCFDLRVGESFLLRSKGV